MADEGYSLVLRKGRLAQQAQTMLKSVPYFEARNSVWEESSHLSPHLFSEYSLEGETQIMGR